MKRILAILLLASLTIAIPAQAEMLSWSWDAPTEGTAVDHYVVRISVNSGPFLLLGQEPTINSVTFDHTPNSEYRVQVAGVDIDGHQGGWSEISLPEVWGAPGGCGMPWQN